MDGRFRAPSPLRGRRSRNKVSVGEPAEGSFTRNVQTHHVHSHVGAAARAAIVSTPRRSGAPGVDGWLGQRSLSGRATACLTFNHVL